MPAGVPRGLRPQSPLLPPPPPPSGRPVRSGGVLSSRRCCRGCLGAWGAPGPRPGSRCACRSRAGQEAPQRWPLLRHSAPAVIAAVWGDPGWAAGLVWSGAWYCSAPFWGEWVFVLGEGWCERSGLYPLHPKQVFPLLKLRSINYCVSCMCKKAPCWFPLAWALTVAMGFYVYIEDHWTLSFGVRCWFRLSFFLPPPLLSSRHLDLLTCTVCVKAEY